MDYQMIATPVVGAIIGYTTNWVAIKMLFRPYAEKRFLGLKIPFTPGLIPKERERIARAIGEVVEQYLLTDEVIVSELTSETTCEAIGAVLAKELRFNEGYLDLSKIIQDQDEKVTLIQDFSQVIAKKVMEWFLEEETRHILLPKIRAFITHYLDQQDLKSLFQENKGLVNRLLDEVFGCENIDKLASIIEGYLHQEETLFKLIGPEIKEQIQEILSFNEPKIKQTLKELLHDEALSTGAKEMISSVIASKFGALGAMFANPDGIYDSIVVALNEKIDASSVSKILFAFLEENMQKQFFEWVPEHIKKALSQQISQRILNEKTKLFLLNYLNQMEETPYHLLNRLSDKQFDGILEQWLEGMISSISQNQTQIQTTLQSILIQTITKIIDQPIKISSQMSKKVLEKILKGYQFFIKKYVVKMVQTVKLSPIVEKQINTFEIHVLEDLILAIAKKELNAITWLGALLGFIMSIILLFLK